MYSGLPLHSHWRKVKSDTKNDINVCIYIFLIDHYSMKILTTIIFCFLLPSIRNNIAQDASHLGVYAAFIDILEPLYCLLGYIKIENFCIYEIKFCLRNTSST